MRLRGLRMKPSTAENRRECCCSKSNSHGHNLALGLEESRSGVNRSGATQLVTGLDLWLTKNDFAFWQWQSLELKLKAFAVLVLPGSTDLLPDRVFAFDFRHAEAAVGGTGFLIFCGLCHGLFLCAVKPRRSRPRCGSSA